jgi:hypothetical protein
MPEVRFAQSGVWRRYGRNDLGSSTPTFVPNQTNPTYANTGLQGAGLATSDLTTVIAGDLIVNDAYVAANGTTLDKYWVKGFLVYSATSTVTMTRSQVEGRTFTTLPVYSSDGAASGVQAVVHCRKTGSGLFNMQACNVWPSQPDVNLTSFQGEHVGSLDRCYSKWGSDIVDYWSPAVPNVTSCCFEKMTFWSNDPKHTTDGSKPGWSHNDCVQNSGSVGGKILGNTLSAYLSNEFGNWTDLRDGNTLAGTGAVAGHPDLNWGSCVALTPSTSPITNLEAGWNWYHGGEVHLQFPSQTGGSTTGQSLNSHDNRHDLGQFPFSTAPHYAYQHNRGTDQYSLTAAMFGTDFYMDTLNVPSAMRGQPIPDVFDQTSSLQFVQQTTNPTYPAS